MDELNSKIKYLESTIQTILKLNINLEKSNSAMLNKIIDLDQNMNILLTKISILEQKNLIYDENIKNTTELFSDKWKNTILKECNLHDIIKNIKYESIAVIHKDYIKLQNDHKWIIQYIYADNSLIDYVYEYFIINLDDKIKKQEYIMTNKTNVKNHYNSLNKLKKLTKSKLYYYDNQLEFIENIDNNILNIYQNKTKEIFKTLLNISIICNNICMVDIIDKYKLKILITYTELIEKKNKYYIFAELMEICYFFIELIEYIKPDVIM